MTENILQKILATKQQEVAQRKELYPVKLLEQSVYFHEKPVSLRHYLGREDLVGVIAEIKRRSPSKGVINEYIEVEGLSIGYMQAGASALSVLTDEQYFGGRSEDLSTARKFNFCPILRKDFIVDEYQVIEAKSIGADVILLIAAALSDEQLASLAKQAKSLGLEVLVEVHSEEELNRSTLSDVDVIGVNNRNLEDFTVSVETSHELGAKVPKEFLKISESGIEEPTTIKALIDDGFSGFLIGERFMRHPRPAEACRDFIRSVHELIDPRGAAA